MSEDKTTEIAQKWMEMADNDENGTIEFEEFQDLVTKLDESISRDDSKTIFDAHDTEGSGSLSVVDFGKAIYASLKTMKADPEEEHN